MSDFDWILHQQEGQFFERNSKALDLMINYDIKYLMGRNIEECLKLWNLH